MIFTSLHLCLLQHEKVPVRRIGAYRQKRSTGNFGTVADTVANDIGALLTYQ